MKNAKKKNILVTGGAGYIGSHMVRMLQDNGYNPIVFDNLCTGKRSAVSKGVPFIKGDLRKPQDIKKIFSEYKIDAITHFAALIVVPESVVYPMKYYENNVMGSYNLIKASIEHKMRKFIFSSTAAVYGSPAKMPVTEDVPRLPENPYGTTKMIVEDILKDASHAYDFAYVALRYFNVDGAHPSGVAAEGPGDVADLVVEFQSLDLDRIVAGGHLFHLCGDPPDRHEDLAHHQNHVEGGHRHQHDPGDRVGQ
ncbi:MAG TPA: NAD-dependent epimerase/dehydratase family protein [Candidatus Omnitrophota bacterium]|nr:NAD-dependent epimerase/dehydratase family protein [Candidatus Omnitrophota bacterium]